MNENLVKRNECLAQTVIKGLQSRNMSGYYAANKEEALKQAEEAINYSIRSTVEGTASLQEEYRAACERQRQIDRRKAAGEKIPAGWIRNPFYRKFYRDRGMLADH